MSYEPQQVRIVIADDHALVREAIRRLLEAANFKVVGETSDGAEALRLARQLKPDILLLDLAMRKHPGLDALPELSVTNAIPVRLILLVAAAEKSQIVEALQLGARGVVIKDSAAQLLDRAIQTVMAGEYWVGRASVSNLLQYLRTLMQSSYDAAWQKKFGLTPRELEIVSAVVCGLLQQGKSRIAQDQCRHGQASSLQHLGQIGCLLAFGAGAILASQEARWPRRRRCSRNCGNKTKKAKLEQRLRCWQASNVISGEDGMEIITARFRGWHERRIPQ